MRSHKFDHCFVLHISFINYSIVAGTTKNNHFLTTLFMGTVNKTVN